MAMVMGCTVGAWAALAAGEPGLIRPPPPSDAEPLTVEAIMRHVAFMVDPRLAGRLAGSTGEAITANYVDGVLEQAGLLPHRQYVTLPQGTSINVYATIGGTSAGADEVVVIGAHMDHLGPRFPGAEDNASGVAVVLELARALARRRHELHRPILFVFFGAEESKFMGAKFFVRAPPVPVSRMAVMVNVDMIGRPLLDQTLLGPAKRAFGIDGKRSIGLVGTRHRPALRALVDKACVQAGIEAVASEDLPDWMDREIAPRATGRDDSVAFAAVGVPSILLGSGESSDYHAPSDTLDRLHPEVMRRRGQALLRVLLALSETPRSTFASCGKCDAGTPLQQRPTPHGWKLPIGLGTGWSIHGSGASGVYLGAEASLVRFESKSLFWLGGYADVVRDYASRRTRASLGFELGKGAWGVDGGYAMEFSSDFSWPERRQGFVLRPLVSLSYLSITGRFGYLWGQASGAAFGELGVLLKVPLIADWSSAPTQ